MKTLGTVVVCWEVLGEGLNIYVSFFVFFFFGGGRV